MRPITSILILLFMLVSDLAFSQLSGYKYKRELKGISELWHKIVVPETVSSKLQPSLNDLKILGITSVNDTVEAPYILVSNAGKISETQPEFRLINESSAGNEYMFSFELPVIQSINQVNLEFEQRNFDWRLKLEGSHDQENWFTILNDYRITSIKNKEAEFKFTRLVFPESKYRYYRISIPTKQKPLLINSSITKKQITPALLRTYFSSIVLKKENELKQTEIHVKTDHALPISFIHINVKDTLDYFRPVTIQYVKDSFHTENGWQYLYSTLATGILTSADRRDYELAVVKAQRLKTLIDNEDNQPLSIGSIDVKGLAYEISARFSKPGKYFLVYGKENAVKPSYDIARFTEKIPASLSEVSVGEEEIITEKGEKKLNPLFSNKAWLWVVLVLTILMLGWFSLRMIRSENTKSGN